MGRVTTIVPFARILPSDPPRAAYLHVPFCAHRCGYCNFTLVAGRDDLIDRYLEAIAAELAWLGTPRPVDTLVFRRRHADPIARRRPGPADRTARRWFPLADGYELSIEANPADVTDDRWPSWPSWASLGSAWAGNRSTRPS